MARKKKLSATISRSKAAESSYWKITAILVSVFAMGLFIKAAFFQQSVPINTVNNYQPASSSSGSLERQVRLVASNFKCACGGCGELPLAECACDMPRGAVEEKDYIRKKLQEGFTVEQVVQFVNETYGHMNS